MNKSSRPITLSALARLLKVHVSTVSRILNGSEDEAKTAAAPETIKRVRDLAERLNYRPNPHAIGLRTQKTRTVGVLMPQLTDIVVATIYEGIDAAANAEKYLTFVAQTGDIPERQREMGESAVDRRVEGLIICDSRLDERHFIDELEKRGVPMVLTSRRLEDHCSVTCDDFEGGRLAAEHLYSLGHRHVAVLAGAEYASSGVDRTAGFIAYYDEHGIDVPRRSILHGPFHTKAGRQAGEMLFRQSRQPTAVFAVNDFLAIGLMGALRDSGLRPGEDVAIVGFNDTPISAELPISLTTVHSPLHEIGRRSFELLMQRIGGQRPRSEMFAPHLIVRSSSGVRNAVVV